MIKKILCPTDFSEASLTGIEYASKLAQALNAQITLINIVKTSIGEGVTLFAGGERASVKEANSSHALLDDYCKEISMTCNITCNQIILPVLGSIEDNIAETGKDFDLIVMGTNGVNELFSYYFGTHSFHVAKKVTTPVLIVPSDCTFKPLKKIIFASDYNTADVIFLKQIKQFIDLFNSDVKVIHVSKNNSELSQQVYRSFTNIMEEELSSFPRLSFQRIIGDDVQQQLEDIVNKTNPDLLITCLEEHNFLYKLVHRNLVKRLIDVSETPILVMHV